VPASLFQDFSDRSLKTGFAGVSTTFGEKVFFFCAVMDDADLLGLNVEDDGADAFDELVSVELEGGE